MYQFAVFGGGCFWCTEAVFQQLKGVISVIPGYAGGKMINPTYEDVSKGDSGHAEVIGIEFDPTVIPYSVLLDVFWNTHNPTSLNRQGNDVGTQYRSIILYTNEDQKMESEQSLENLQHSGEYTLPIVTEVRKLESFYKAEDYHKNYYETHKEAPYCQLVIAPKLHKLQEKYAKNYKI
ncbi:peptide-methionine (S)-S-oxide reductase MsrA [Candidatus Roizmanbacteria bacterium]|nr:peptide-methionine (S)-S-oxide reductase MsrA [Candidatus Roizmanbacteria bacterium]